MSESEGEKRESHSQSDVGECLGDTAKIFLSSWLKMLNFSKSFNIPMGHVICSQAFNY